MYDILTLQAFIQIFYQRADGSIPALSIDSYSYGLTLTNVSVDAGDQSTGQIRINANADFVALMIFIVTVNADSVFTSGYDKPLRIQLTRAGTSEPFFSEALAIQNVCATAQYPDRFLEWPKLLKAGTTVVVDIFGDTGPTPAAEVLASVDVILHGVNVQKYTA